MDSFFLNIFWSFQSEMNMLFKAFGIINVVGCWTFFSSLLSFIIFNFKKKFKSHKYILMSANCVIQYYKLMSLLQFLTKESRIYESWFLDLCILLFVWHFWTIFSAGFWFAPIPTVQLTFTLRTTFILMLKQAIHMPDLSGTEANVCNWWWLSAPASFIWICLHMFHLHSVNMYISSFEVPLLVFPVFRLLFMQQ